MLSKTSYNLQIYNREIEKLHVNTDEWKYINIINASTFFLLELEEMKSCVYRVETANAEMWLKRFWHHLFPTAAWETCTFFDPETLQNTIFDDGLQTLSNAHPAYFWVAFL